MKKSRLLVAFAVAWCASACELLEDPLDKEPPVLLNLGIELGAYDPDTGRAGAFVLDTSLASIFTELGPEGPSFGYGYVLATNQEIVSPLGGRVTSLDFDGALYRVTIKPKSDSIWALRIEGFSAPAVSDGDAVGAGDPIGSTGGGGYQDVFLRLDDTDKDRAWCPLAFFDAGSAASVGSSLAATLATFEALKSDPDIWDESAWTLPGCTADSVPY